MLFHINCHQFVLHILLFVLGNLHKCVSVAECVGGKGWGTSLYTSISLSDERPITGMCEYNHMLNVTVHKMQVRVESVPHDTNVYS